MEPLLISDCDLAALVGFPVVRQLSKILGSPAVAASFRRYPELWNRMRHYVRLAINATRTAISQLEEEAVMGEEAPMLIDLSYHQQV